MLLLAIAICLLLFASTRAKGQFRTYFNPWFIFLCTDVLLLHVLSIFSAAALDLIQDKKLFDAMLLGSSVYIGGYALAIFVKSSILQNLIKSIVGLIPDVRATGTTSVLSYIIFGGSFFILIFFGEGGTLWFTDPRFAYLNFRGATGDGALFVLAQWTLMLSAVINLSKSNNTKSAFIIALLFHSLFAYFMGSKQILMNIIVFSIFVIDFKYNIIRLRHFLGFGLIGVLLFLAMLGSTDEDGALTFAGLYFSEYAVSTVRIFESGFSSYFFAGDILISNYWTFIPRFLVESKPFEYGQVLINSVLFPGAAERGQTPGLLYWSSWYVDFGFFGVFAFGLIRGVLDGAVFTVARSLTKSPVKTALLFSMSVLPIFLYAPIAYQFIFILLTSIGFNILKLRRPTPDSLRSAQL